MEIKFLAYLKQTGQPVRLHSEGGGILALEFSDDALDEVMELYKNGKERALLFTVSDVTGPRAA